MMMIANYTHGDTAACEGLTWRICITPFARSEPEMKSRIQVVRLDSDLPKADILFVL